MSTHNPEELAPLLNPMYWDGHMIGDGQLTPPNPDIFVGPFLGSSVRFAKNALRERLATMRGYTPLEIFNKGKVFDAQEWPVGTITLADRETLISEDRPPQLDTETYASIELPLRPTDLHPNLAPNTQSRVVGDNDLGIVYVRAMHWGVVTPTSSGKQAWHTTSTSFTDRTANNKVRTGPFLPRATPLEIGKTAHGMSIMGKQREVLSRVNILHVIALGSEKREKTKTPFRLFLGRIATGNA